MVNLVLCSILTMQVSSIDFSEGKMPKIANCLVLANPKRKNYQVGHSSFQLAIRSGWPSGPKAGDSFGGSIWKQAQPNEDGFIFTNNGNSPIYAEWTEPTDRKVLAQFMFGGSELLGHYVNGKLQPSNPWGDIPYELTPLSLRAGKQTIIAGSAMRFLLYPVRSKFVFNPKTALVADVRFGETKLYDGSVTVVNCTDADQAISLHAQVDEGPVTTTKVPTLPAMNSRIIRFKFKSHAALEPGTRKLKLWVKDDLPSMIDIRVAKNGEPFRRTYVGKNDEAVHAYTVVPPPEGSAGQAIVGFLYGGNPEGSHVVAQEFKSRPGYSVVIPEARGATWSGISGRDAMETLDQACRELRSDKTRSYLFGHSMGGHGAYLLASLNPTAFAGVGSSAGWISLYTYLYPLTQQKLLSADDPIERVFSFVHEEQRVENRFDALAKVKNFAVVHGTKDVWVPMAETLRLRDEMVKREARFEVIEQPGLDHFWSKDGMNQYDFPPVIGKMMASPQRGDGRFMNLSQMPPTWHKGISKRVAIVYGTRGSTQENSDALEKARSEEARLRNFMRLESRVLSDEVKAPALKGWDVLLIGNSRTNALWDEHPTANARLSEATKRGHKVDGWLIQSRKGNDTWSLIGGSTQLAAKTVYLLTQMWFEAPFPEWTLFDSSRQEDGFGWVVGCGNNNGAHGWRTGGNLN